MSGPELPEVPPSLDLRVRSVVAQQVRIAPDDLTGDLRLAGDLGVTRESEPALLSAMGEALDAVFPDDFLDGLETYGELASAVRLSLRS